MTAPSKAWFNQNYETILKDMKDWEISYLEKNTSVDMVEAATTSLNWHKFVEGVTLFYVAMDWQ